ncbi:alpha/beta hydrolase [Catellatospora sp. NPDC049609]|uniref:alpha/beta hydrolase n=1 Tax=Catellatospora sp. NPDC049609 TaxID=3155505 RepID=UPI0034294DCD
MEYTRHRRLALFRPVLLTAVTLATIATGTGSPALAEPTRNAPLPQAPATAVPARFLDQVIDWRPCDSAPPDPGKAKLECGKVAVPKDWADSEQLAEITMAVSRLRPLEGSPVRTVFVNPGGPGAPGLDMPLWFQLTGRQRLLDNVELIGFDVRGTGQSTTVRCDGHGFVRDDVDPRNRSTENLSLLVDASVGMAQGCQEASRELGRYITTEQTVRDLDLLRQLLGRNKISWIGYSGGTWTGAYYATYFRSHVDKFVFDSNVDFTDSMQGAFLRQPRGFERRFRSDFLPWVAQHANVYGLGTTAEEVRAEYERIRASLAAHPVDLGDGFLVHPNTLDYYLIVPGVYSKYSFAGLADILVYLSESTQSPSAGDMAVAAKIRSKIEAGKRGAGRGLSPVSADTLYATFWSIVCNDTPWPGGVQFAVEESARQGARYPLIGWNAISDPLMCQSWNRPNVVMPAPNGVGVPPVLMVQSERDPATPIEGAERAHSRFAGSRMVRVQNEGDHGIYALTGNACVDTIVESYLIDGILPAADVVCAGVPIPAPGVAASAARNLITR